MDAESKRLGESIDQRLQRRQRESTPIVDQLRAWLDRRRGEVEPKCVLGKALNYLHRQWPRLTVFLHDPCMELTNNEVESGLRTWVLCRRNHYGSRSRRGTEVAALYYSLIESAKLVGVGPHTYLATATNAALRGAAIPLPHQLACPSLLGGRRRDQDGARRALTDGRGWRRSSPKDPPWPPQRPLADVAAGYYDAE